MNIHPTKLEIAEEILKNTPNIYMQKVIQEYRWYCDSIENGEFECNEDNMLIPFHSCISYIKEVGFDIKGWGLWEIPIDFLYCFFNETTGKWFDLAVENIDEVKPAYIDSWSNQQIAKSIEEAINKNTI
ncbi:hypothetical protein [Bacillus cereus]|uniref:hypothetical protein n=1 Tax=Bacillus cereus TaxID=1396 RepID=UPI000BFE3B38|nr:hypothetical protein [Bacillus cereus]PGR00760.1 hypothetical protein COA24_12770 [Bacillus cereus]